MSKPRTRTRILRQGKWVAEVCQGCCNWLYLDAQNSEPYIPTMPYMNYHECSSQEEARKVEQKFLARFP